MLKAEDYYEMPGENMEAFVEHIVRKFQSRDLLTAPVVMFDRDDSAYKVWAIFFDGSTMLIGYGSLN